MLRTWLTTTTKPREAGVTGIYTLLYIIKKEMEALLGLIALIAVALVGWAIAEFKYKAFTFTRSEKDIEEEAELEEQHRADGFKEMNIRDIMRKNSTNGYNAVG